MEKNRARDYDDDADHEHNAEPKMGFKFCAGIIHRFFRSSSFFLIMSP